MTVSIVVPVYNVEKYLPRCVDSLLSQTYTDIEIILVDDGSPDGCPEMCDDYAKSDSRIKAVHKKNGGLPDARNAGIAAATGEYIMFIDSDDFIEENTVEFLADIAGQYDTDCIMYDAVWDGRRGIPDGTPVYKEPSRCLTPGFYDELKINTEIKHRAIITPDLFYAPILSACFLFIRKEFLDSNSIRFDPEIKYSEDSVFSSRISVLMKRFYYTDKHFYHYCFNGESISQKNHPDDWEVAKIRQSFFESYFSEMGERDRDIRDQIDRMAIFNVLCVINRYDGDISESEKRVFVKNIMNDSFTVKAMKNIRKAKVPFKKKIILWLIRLRLPRVYLFLLRK